MALSGAVAGLIAGMLLSEAVSLIGPLIVHKPVGIPYLALYLTGLGALVGLVIARRRPPVAHKGP